MTPWYETVNTEAVFKVMRTIDGEYTRHMERAKRMAAPAGTIAVGPAGFEPILRAEARRLFLNALRKGLNPEDAREAAAEGLKAVVRNHNAKRPNDVYWQRWEGAGQIYLPNLVWRVRNVA